MPELRRRQLAVSPACKTETGGTFRNDFSAASPTARELKWAAQNVDQLLSSDGQIMT
jgi:hypothetical protein